jgi:hypothetical protein
LDIKIRRIASSAINAPDSSPVVFQLCVVNALGFVDTVGYRYAAHRNRHCLAKSLDLYRTGLSFHGDMAAI